MKYDHIEVQYRCRYCGKTFFEKYDLGVICNYEKSPNETDELILFELKSILKDDKFGNILPHAFHNCYKERENSLLEMLEGAPAGMADIIRIKTNKPTTTEMLEGTGRQEEG